MVICSFDEYVSYQNNWGGTEYQHCSTLKDAVSYKLGRSSVSDVVYSLRRASFKVNINYSDGTSDSQVVGLVEDNVFTYLENGDYTARENNTEYVNDNKTYFASQYNESYKEIEKIQYSFYTTGALYSITSTLGNISQTLCSLIVKLAHSTNIDSDSMLEIDNAIFELTKGSATTNRFYVDIDSDNNVVLPMNTMSEMTELVQTRVGDNIVFNTKSSVDFDRPLEAVSDGSSDLGRVFDFDYTKYYNSSVTSVSGIKETEEDLHILAQLLQEHADSPDQLHMCYGRVAVINGKLVSLPDELFYNNGGWMLESAQRFSYSGGNELMLDLIDNGYVLENIGLTRIPGTDYTINIRNEIDKSDCRYDAVKSYLSNNSWEYVYLYPYSVANPFRITVDLSGETSNENISNFLDKLQALSSDSFETKAAQATFNNQYYNSTSNELGFEYSVDSVGGWNSGYLSNGIQLYYSTNWTRVYDDSSIPDETGTSSGFIRDIRSIAGNRGRINTYAEFGGTGSVRSSSYKNGGWRYYNQTNVYSPLKIVLDFKSNNYELMNKYLEIVNECGFNVIGNESYMPDFDNADKISVKSFLPYTESIGVKGTWVHTDAAAYAKYGDFESGVKKNTDEIIEDTYDGYQISFPLDMLQNKEKGTPYNVVNQVMMMSTEINGHYDYSDARLGAYYRDGTWAHKGNVYYLDGEFIRSYNTATEYDSQYSMREVSQNNSSYILSGEKGLLRHTEYKWGEVVLASRPDPVEDLAFDKNTFKLTFTKPVDEGFVVETSDTPERETTKKDDVVYVNSYTIKVVNDQDEVTYETTIARDQKFDDVTFVVPENAVDYSSRKNKIVVYCTNILGDSVEREIEFELTPAVEITMTPDKPLYKDSETVVYTETVKNTGETKLTNVVVNQDLIGQYVPQDGLTAMGTTAKIPDLKPGESYTFYFKVPTSVAVDDIIINNADVETAQNVSYDDTCTVNVYRVESQDTPKPAEYDIKVSTTYEKKVYNDLEDIVFIDVVTNTGDTTLTNVVVREAFTKGGYTDVADGTLNKNGSVTIDKLEPGESVTLLYTINAKDAPIAEDGTVINNLTATADEGVSDDDSTLVEVVHYSINVTKLVDNQNYRKGDNVVFTNIVTNDGNTKLTNIKVTEDLDGTFTLTNGAVIMNDHIMIAELAPGESYTYYYVVPANDENVADGRVTSVVTATASEDSIAESSDKVSATDTNFALIIDPEIEVTKTVDGRTYKIGETVVWTDTITNKGDVPLTNVVVTESIDGTFDVEYETDGSSFTIPKLDVGESYTFTFSTVVTNENISDFIHTTTVKAAADEGVNDNDTKDVPVNAAAIKVVKTVTEYEYTPDGTIIYTDIITNTGDTALTEVIVKEDLPGKFISYDPKYTADGDTLTIDRIEKGQTVVVKYEVKVSDVDYSTEDPTITSTVTAEAKEGVKDDDSVDVIVIIPDPEPVSEDSEPVSENVEPDTTTDIEPEVEKDSEPDTTTDVIVPETTTDTESVSETDSDNTKIEGGTVEKDSEPEITTDTNTTTDTTVPESETDTTVVPETNPDTTVVPETNPDTTVVPETNPDTTVVPEPETDTTVVPEPTTDTTSETPSDTPTTDTSQTQIGGGTAEKKDSDTPKTETDNKQNTTPTTTTTVVNNPIPQQSGGGSADPVKTGDSRNAIGYAVAMLTALFVFAVCRKREEDQF